MAFYNGTNSRRLASSLDDAGNYNPQRIWVGFNPDYSAKRAERKAAQKSSYPILMLFDERNAGGLDIEPLEEHYYLSGHLKVGNLIFLNPFGQKGAQGLYEVAQSVPGAVMRTKGQETKIYLPDEKEVLKYVAQQASRKEEPAHDFMKALQVLHHWDPSAIRDLQVAASKGKSESIDEIVRRAKVNNHR